MQRNSVNEVRLPAGPQPPAAPLLRVLIEVVDGRLLEDRLRLRLRGHRIVTG